MKFLTFILVLVSINVMYAQNAHKVARKGNSAYSDNKYIDAEIKYKTSIELDPQIEQSKYNLGNAYFKQKNYEEAAKQFELSANTVTDKNIKAKSFHNLGNSYLESFKIEKDQKKKGEFLDQSIEAYKNALKINPADKDTKYNLSYALKYKNEMQQQQQQNQDKNQNKENENKENQDKNKQNQDQEKKEQEKNEQQNQEQQKQEEKQSDQKKENQQQGEPKEQKMDKKEALIMLKVMEDEEKEVKKKMMLQKQKGQKTKVEKEW